MSSVECLGTIAGTLFAYKVAYPDSCQELDEFSWGHAHIFHTVPARTHLGSMGG
ncbi:MAG: hypothetical protein M1469_12795 [Bacteroidetes bacterium]|nr:hypothetical protein [Bacteroidota bacterium]